MKRFCIVALVLLFAASAAACPVAVRSSACASASASAVVSSQAVVVQPYSVVVEPQVVVQALAYPQVVVQSQAVVAEAIVVPQAVQVLSSGCCGSRVRARALGGFFRPRTRSFSFARTVTR